MNTTRRLSYKQSASEWRMSGGMLPCRDYQRQPPPRTSQFKTAKACMGMPGRVRNYGRGGNREPHGHSSPNRLCVTTSLSGWFQERFMPSLASHQFPRVPTGMLQRKHEQRMTSSIQPGRVPIMYAMYAPNQRHAQTQTGWIIPP